MDQEPFTYDSGNKRIVATPQRPATVYYVGAFLFVGSMLMYNKRYFRKDQNAINFCAFGAASVFASYEWSSFFCSSPDIEAAVINNKREASV